VGAGGWWLASRVAEPAGDGSVIAAPEEPYKVRPADPGGKQHAGTGDTSFAVGEGQTREARIAESAPPPPLAAQSTVAASPVPTVAAPAPTAEPELEPEPAIAGVGVQVGAYYNAAAAERGWSTLIRQTESLQGVKHRVVRGVADIGTVYRLQAVAPDTASANRLCAALRADGLNCQVKR
jgi:cell division protein FtsN